MSLPVVARPAVFAAALLAASASATQEAPEGTAAHAVTPATQDTRPGVAPDIREDDVPLKFQDGDFIAVPIPISNPTLGSGLVVGSAYFYPQTEAEKARQPASFTGLAGFKTSNGSQALGIFQQNYWLDDRWRFTGALGAADVRLALRAPEEGEPETRNLDWRVKGAFLFSRLSRRLIGDWYGGGLLRVVDTDQRFESSLPPEGDDFDTSDAQRAAGLGLSLEYDTRDVPTNPYAGRYFKADLLANSEALGSDRTYQSLLTSFKAYQRPLENLVLAWDLEGCQLAGTAPLWDACRIPLRGFAAFDYLGKTSLSGQLEARWRIHKRWGAVLFGGSGWAADSVSNLGKDESVKSYGAGIRFEVLPAKRINLRVDFARSDADEAVYLSVGEAF